MIARYFGHKAMLATWGCTTFSKPTLDLQFVGATSLDNRITFSRGSQATLFDSTGTLVYANNNLLTYSEDFGNAAWTKTRASVSTNATTAPNGTLTAGKLIEDSTASNTHLAFSGGISVIASTVYTYTIYAKAAERTWFNMQIGTGAEAYGATVPFCYFDLANGAIGSSGSVTGTITPVGNGWYRCSAVAIATTSATTTNMRIKLATGNGVDSYTGDGTSGIFIWGAMLNIGSTAGPYVQTVASAYYAPRFDYNPTTLAAQGLLIEEQRTNSFLQNFDISNASWIKVRATTPGTTTTSPSGGTAQKLVEDTTPANSHFIRQDISVTSGATYTQSVYVKAAERNEIQLAFDVDAGAFTNSAVIFTLSGGGSGVIVAGSPAYSITLVGNGWYRCTISQSAAATATAVFRISLASGGTAFYTGDGTSGLFFWGAQLEQGAFATSVISTTTTALTRNADVASMTGTNFSSWYNASEGTLFAQSQTAQAYAAGVPARVSIDDGTISNRIAMRNGNNFSSVVTVSGSPVAGLELTAWNSNITKQAIAYKVDDFAYTTNGASVVTDTSGAIPSVNRLGIGLTGTQNFLNGYIQRIAYYPVRVTDAQLQALTG